ncbi:hypothetical protein [Microbacterium aurantiacum]|uniref:hypothetical protein n=1 Tax=Microbacterium aurantiacum TaxID=162393 RepID=UPI000AFC6F5B
MFNTEVIVDQGEPALHRDDETALPTAPDESENPGDRGPDHGCRALRVRDR